MLQLQLKGRVAAAGPFGSMLLDDASRTDVFAALGPMTIRYLYEIESGRKMTAVQQSVPAWLIFGMYFVVIPLTGVLIQERNDGTLARLSTFGVSPFAILGGKLLAFMALNWVQLLLMLWVGRWLVPLLGGDTLYLDLQFTWFLLMVFATSASAVGLALLIGAYTRSFDHAAALGGGANVVLAALAGIMVPRPLMPAAMQTVSEWSPMGWALDGMQAVFPGCTRCVAGRAQGRAAAVVRQCMPAYRLAPHSPSGSRRLSCWHQCMDKRTVNTQGMQAIAALNLSTCRCHG